MALDRLDSISKLKGLMVEVTEKGHKYVGTIDYYEKDTGVLGLLMNSQLQIFQKSNIDQLEILGEKPKMSINLAKFKKSEEEEMMKKIFNSVRPERQRQKFDFISKRRGDNPHLAHLHNVQLKKILVKNPPPSGTPAMVTYLDEKNQPYHHLPPVKQTAQSIVDENGREWNGGHTERVVREKTWQAKDQYPAVDTPSRLYIIDNIEGDLFHDAVNILDQRSIIGFSSEGKMMGRKRILSWMIFSTDRDVFMFDIVKLGKDAFKYGLEAVLQNSEVTKVVHNSGQLHDCLFHQWNISMVNVIDTMAADLVFCKNHVWSGYVPKYFRGLPRLLMDYLGIDTSDIFYPRYRMTHLAEDSEVWLTRPAADHLVLGAARNCLYLLSLHRQIR